MKPRFRIYFRLYDDWEGYYRDPEFKHCRGYKYEVTPYGHFVGVHFVQLI